jgi:cyclase
MLAKRVIPCLDVHDGKVTRGVQFGVAEKGGLRNVGDPVELALRYNEQGADEMVFFDITATAHGRGTMVDVIERAASQCFMPLTVGGGIRTLDDATRLIQAGTEKVSLNSAAVKTPELITEVSRKFGRCATVVNIDPRRVDRDGREFWEVHINGGRKPTGLEAVAWAREVERLGAGEIVLTSMDADGTKNGYDLPMLSAVSRAVNIPVVASGGAGGPDHLRAAFEAGADAALAASIFHYGEYTIPDTKEYLARHGIPVRRL